MNKFFLSIATSAVCLTGMATQAQAAPAWAQSVANHGCKFLRQGYSARTSGEKAAIIVLGGPYAQDMLNAQRNGTLGTYVKSTMIDTCASTLIKAANRTSI